MKISFFDPTKFDVELKGECAKRIIGAANVIKNYAKGECRTGTISHPMYKTGKYAGQRWTSRDAGRLKKSIRVVIPEETKHGDFRTKTNVRVYAGHYMAWYAAIVEFYSHYMRKGKNKAKSGVEAILGIKK
jgi:hypothetical protein